ncbi:energy transducer TonB [Bdellovibrio reynosensis]|uniref:Energy transducer TonB n=1 Tax=Bdellovibrio reynosensis TaxID=2835041 RepID=A0ABY4CC94_9BACT|nr:energy transducer TonB [Bdellovibrio reynosensis]UOF01291.1 energy transducer TonB [Bdellovibrio reynosensis]
MAFTLTAPQIIKAPIGVELMMGDSAAPKSSAPVAAPQIEQAQTTTVVDNSDGPAIKEEVKPVAVQPVQASQTAGSAEGSSSKGAVSGREGVADGAEVSPEDRYLYELKKLLERRKRYPMMAKRMGQSGKVTMRFTLNADGSLSASEIIEKSPFDTLNQAAVELVKGIDGMKPFPKEIQRGSWSITVPIEYVLN